MEYPEIEFKDIKKVRNGVYYSTYICLLPQRYDRIFRKVKSLLLGRFKVSR